ncbi:MAG: MBL fold metallo-hydrolase [Acetilactobacillus jinshanensis]
MSFNGSMKICLLSSGSGGNSTYIQTAQHQVLLDAGLSGVKIERLLSSIHRDPHQIDMLLVSHEHSDHAKGVGILARKYPNIKVYANQKTWEAMAPKIGPVDSDQQRIFPEGKTLNFGDLDIQSFGTSHDSADSQYYKFTCNGKSFAMITDAGYVSRHIQKIIMNCEAFAMESNYDVEMLRHGPYSWPLKRRILSDVGHLSNDQSADILLNVIGNKTKYVFLAHRSHNNNTVELAHNTVANVLRRNGLPVGRDFKIYDTDVESPTPLVTI